MKKIRAIPVKNQLVARCFRPAAAAAVLAGVMGAAAPMTAFAASPEFSRTAEEWGRLQDDVIEYGEIADLVHEYNATVQNNQHEYNAFIKDYGTTRDDIADAYQDLADDLESSKSGDDSGAAMVSDLQLELQAKQLREQADDNIEDSHIYYLNYSQAEASLALSARSKYISYYSSRLELQSAQAQKQNLENQLSLVNTRRSAGTATDADVLDAQEAVLSQEKTIAELGQQIENTRQSLVVMLGWKGSDQPELTGLPKLDLTELDAIDLEADKQMALENNYTLQINKRKLENAKDNDNKNNLQKTIANNERKIGVSVTSAYQSLKTTRLSYEQAVTDQTTAERNMSLTQQKWNAGMITKYDYEQQQTDLSDKQLAVQKAEWSLLDALESYRANVNGLAGAE